MARKTIDADLKVLTRFVEVYCSKRHATNGQGPCADCRDLLEYARGRLERCPHDPKPKCKDCTTHCYRPDYRKRIQEVMRFSGMHFVKRGRLDWMIRYFM